MQPRAPVAQRAKPSGPDMTEILLNIHLSDFESCTINNI